MTTDSGGGLGRAVVAAGLVVVFSLLAIHCRKKISPVQCEQMVARFAQLVVQERAPGAGPEAIAAEQARERREAMNADEFKNCASQVQENEYACAMSAESSDALIKCLE